eukprot:TRINITY_DN2128_c0_g1_i1.p2 TRINITY_DN2128_c0_g1~~TRINITY_DN2128_c0_g1_i1.p2  ORF type:complete len:255 (+),score=69.11 TRINITY_DN2128_c0_g1_i1:140-904(+)
MSVFSKYLTDSRLVQLQAGSGIGFSTFLILHLTNAIAASSGELGWDGVREFFRLYYQNPFVEVVTVFGSLLLHAGTSSIIFYRRNERQKRVKKEDGDKDVKKTVHIPLALQLHRFTGYILTGLTFAHIFATRISTFIWDLDVDFQFLNWGLASKPVLMFPYYVLFSFSGIYHLSYGLPQALRVIFGVKLPDWTSPRRPYFWIWNGLVGLGVLSGILSLSGLLFPTNTSRFALLDEQFNGKVNQILQAVGLKSVL